MIPTPCTRKGGCSACADAAPNPPLNRRHVTERVRLVGYGAGMSLDYSIAHLMNRLTGWAGFPKYQLERRVDIFLTPFLESFVSCALKRRAVLVAPEFPVLRDLCERGPHANRRELTRRTVNVDYLMHLPGPEAAWLFVELKTDCGSFDPEQAKRYAIAKARGTTALCADLEYVRENTDACDKYELLQAALPRATAEQDRIVVAYLAPEALRCPVLAHTYAGGPGEDPARTVDHFFSLESFASQSTDAIPPEHRDLWPYVRDLLRAVERGPATRTR